MPPEPTREGERDESDPADPTAICPRAGFVTTHWSVVLTAGSRDSTHGQEALARLCETYWFPLYAYVRRRGHPPEDARDLTQGFFAQLIEHRWVEDADRAKGRFRTFLLTALSRFLANEWKRAHAHKRGGAATFLPLDPAAAEERYQSDAGRALTPDQLYDRRWAMTLLERALARLAAGFEAAGKGPEFAALSPFLTADRREIPYASVAARLGLNEPAARQAVHRFRKRFREAFREEIAQTVSAPAEAEAEVRHLLAALGT